jgi:YD repeat-containing protein
MHRHARANRKRQPQLAIRPGRKRADRNRRKGNDTVHVYNPRGQKTSTTDRLGGVTAWTYDAGGNLLSLTDAENQTTSYTYDALSRKTTETYPDHVPNSSIGSLDYGIVAFAYDPVGRLSVKTDQQGDTCTYTADGECRITPVSQNDGAFDEPDR